MGANRRPRRTREEAGGGGPRREEARGGGPRKPKYEPASASSRSLSAWFRALKFVKSSLSLVTATATGETFSGTYEKRYRYARLVFNVFDNGTQIKLIIVIDYVSEDRP